MPARNEAGNIADAIARTEGHTEVIFVEGHSQVPPGRPFKPNYSTIGGHLP
ncbi:hypothetical protein XM38_040960 [Halomicronema hongdechloris C2206]|uniref:Uncharacterized protein n=1 Tax=Halomicronema hongdechloris C2206 TaxID=1641165 RepID=A0A1Z3HS44_9CYAN|nr:hypothetical protein [Halomicronema hongdechloris]ASC73134.1 hypothetical protein XM38_040960 [Halomicronema hongdechloris C2206]